MLPYLVRVISRKFTKSIQLQGGAEKSWVCWSRQQGAGWGGVKGGRGLLSLGLGSVRRLLA
jgi:hypothetical protein